MWRERDTKTKRERDTETHRERDRERERNVKRGENKNKVTHTLFLVRHPNLEEAI